MKNWGFIIFHYTDSAIVYVSLNGSQRVCHHVFACIKSKLINVDQAICNKTEPDF